MLMGIRSCLNKLKKVAETTFDIHFDIVMVHKSFHPIKLIFFFQVIVLLLTFLQCSHTKQW